MFTFPLFSRLTLLSLSFSPSTQRVRLFPPKWLTRGGGRDKKQTMELFLLPGLFPLRPILFFYSCTLTLTSYPLPKGWNHLTLRQQRVTFSTRNVAVISLIHEFTFAFPTTFTIISTFFTIPPPPTIEYHVQAIASHTHSDQATTSYHSTTMTSIVLPLLHSPVPAAYPVC